MAERFDPEVMNPVRDFYRGLDEKAANAFDAAVELLIEMGPRLGRPTVEEITLLPDYRAAADLFGKRLKELRVSTIRVLFTFGPDRVPVLLVAGDKAGDWKRWYREAIPAAAREYRAYLEDIGAK